MLQKRILSGWLAVQVFAIGYSQQETLNQVRTGRAICLDAKRPLVAGLETLLLPVSLLVPPNPEVVTYCATQRAELQLKSETK